MNVRRAWRRAQLELVEAILDPPKLARVAFVSPSPRPGS